MEWDKFLIGLLAIVPAAALVVNIVGQNRASRKETADQAAASARISVNVDYIKNSVDEIKTGMTNVTKELADLDHRVTIVEQSTKSAHKRLDEHLHEEKTV